ncbi:MAG: acyltransferase family protein [Desulfobacteraceae bacterium]|nr:acyltransferase family protein [Desulfobacteraceae bacterium]
MAAKEESRNRVLLFDHIRYLMVLLVVVLHAGCAYSYLMPYWPVNDANSKVFYYLIFFLDNFLMPVLFFIAGFFTLPSLLKKGALGFVKTKFIQLGIPLAIGMFLFMPTQNFIHHYSREFASNSLWDHFWQNILSAISFHTGEISSNLQFNHGHFWFISLLLSFFVVVAFLFWIKTVLVKNDAGLPDHKEPSQSSILWVLSGVGMMITILTFLLIIFFYNGNIPRSWLLIGNVIMFQPLKIIFYVSCFGTGIYAYTQKWFTQVMVPMNFLFWACVSSVLFIILIALNRRIYLTEESLAEIFLFLLISHFLFFSILLALISFGTRYWNTASKVDTIFSQNSYHTYLLHMIFVFIFQLVLFKWLHVSVFLKFAIVSILAIGSSVLIAHYVTRPYPKLSIAGIVGFFFLLTIFI